MTTILATTAGAYIKSIHGQTSSGISADQDTVFKYQLTLYKYQYLYDSVITQLNTYIRYFSLGNFDALLKNAELLPMFSSGFREAEASFYSKTEK
jgi:hypothetical protein